VEILLSNNRDTVVKTKTTTKIVASLEQKIPPTTKTLMVKIPSSNKTVVFLETETLLSNKVEVALAEEASVVALVEEIGNLGPRLASQTSPRPRLSSKAELMRVACVAVIGKENEPLFLQTFAESKEDSGLRFHYHAHTALDVIEEKLTKKPAYSTAPLNRELYLGALFTVEDCKVYGYVTNTKIKFVLVLQRVPIGDLFVKNIFRDLHELFIDTMSNPFCKLNSKIESPTFEHKLQNILRACEQRAM